MTSKEVQAVNVKLASQDRAIRAQAKQIDQIEIEINDLLIYIAERNRKPVPIV